ncbi:MAG: glycosyltransferase family 39 protein [Candidatus Sumerlaeaceae bacterium]|nr:glycosyltransferase family 39 protein [Candidatus Sumerlaeaceae bacterium]
MNGVLPNRWRAIRGVFVLGFVVCAIWVSLVNGSVNDEYAAHLTSGYLYLIHGRFAGGVHNPPLGQLWVALPHFLSGLQVYPFTDDAPVLSRLANVFLASFSILLIGEWVRKKAGDAAATLATLTLVGTPEFLAHASLATIDLPLAVTLCGATLSGLSYARSLRLSSLAWTSFWCGLALCVKVSSVLLIPMLAGMFLATFAIAHWHVRLSRLRQRFPKLGTLALHALLAVILVFLIIWASYGFRRCQNGTVQHGSAWMLPHEFLEQIRGKTAYASQGNLAYFNGTVRSGGWWWYYYVNLLLKTPFPLFLLWMGALVLAILKKNSRTRILTAGIIAYLVCVGFNRAQIGIRHLLPLVPLFAVLVGLTANCCTPWLRTAFWGLASAALINSACFLPYPLTAESLLLGGRGYRVFADSNYDWGQANGALRRAMATHGLVRPLPYEITTGVIGVRVNEWAGFRSRTREGYAWLRSLKPSSSLDRAVLIFHVREDDLVSSRHLTSPAATLSLELLRARMEGDCLCPSCIDLLDRLEPTTQKDAAPFLLQMLERSCSRRTIYQTARRICLLMPHVDAAKHFMQRQALLLEAESSALSKPERSAFALANAYWLQGDVQRTLRAVRMALLQGAPDDACAPLVYKACCAMGYWKQALNWAAALPFPTQATIEPPMELVVHLAGGSASSEQWFQLGAYWYRQGLWCPAAKCFIAALARDPSHSASLNILGELVVRYKEETLELSEAQRCELERLALTPTDSH